MFSSCSHSKKKKKKNPEKIKNFHVYQVLHCKHGKFQGVTEYFEMGALFNCMLNAL